MPDRPAFVFDIDRIGAGLPAATLATGLRGLAGPGADAVEPGASGSELPAGAHSGPRAVVEAPPGSGKTTVVPPVVANLVAAGPGRGAGRVIVTQPRRIAARAAANRLAELSGTRVGQEVGYTIRGERHVSAATRVEFVTTGVLLGRLMGDPELAGVSVVVLDEVHERAVDSDLAFAMLRQLVELREDLGLIVMSATLDAGRWAQLLGEDGAPAPVLSVAARPHPLREVWTPPRTPALDARGVTSDFLRHVAGVVAEALGGGADGGGTGPAGAATEAARAGEPVAGAAGSGGDVLVFLPGQREIDRVAGELRGRVDQRSAEVLTLTGRTPAAEQRRIMRSRQDGARRVILATNVAESALTVPGIDLVVDAGLDRQQRLDTGRAMAGLVTVGASKAAMVQRAGRAARLGPGTVIRCMAQADFAARPAQTPPEIRTTDLTEPALQLACWGAPGGAGLRLPDAPPERPLALAQATLWALGALDSHGAATALGHRLARVPADPRLARALFDGAELTGPRAAAEVVAALVSDVRAPGGDLWSLLRGLRRDKNTRWQADVRRFEGFLPGAGGHDGAGPAAGAEDTGLITALAFPDRIARLRPGTAGDYLLAGGTGAELPRDSALKGHTWLAIGDVALTGARALIRAAAVIDQDQAELAGAELLETTTTAEFSGGRVRARRVEGLGAIELSSTPTRADASAARTAVAAFVREQGVLDFLELAEGTQGDRPAGDTRDAAFAQLRGRLGLLHAVYGEPWPDVSLSALAEHATTWLGPDLERVAGGAKPGRIDAVGALRRLLPWPAAAQLDELVPERVPVPSGSWVRLDYPAPESHGAAITAPILAVKLQECFGMADGPAVCRDGVPVLLHLLSPARRPLAVTADLRSFWDNAYPQVRAENRGRYLKHPWPEDPWNAVATARTKNRM